MMNFMDIFIQRWMMQKPNGKKTKKKTKTKKPHKIQDFLDDFVKHKMFFFISFKFTLQALLIDENIN